MKQFHTLLLALVCSQCFAPNLGVNLWNTVNDYISFLVLKSCLGEEVAVELEKEGLIIGRKCLQEMGQGMVPPSGSPSIRKKRNILKMPLNPPMSLQMCNLKAWKLLREDGAIDHEKVETFLRNATIDSQLRGNLLEVSASCKPHDLPTESSRMEDQFKAVVGYLNCLNTGGMKACMDHEMRKYFADL